MNKKTPEDKSDEIAQTDAVVGTPKKTLPAKSEYSSKDKRNIAVGLVVMAIIFIGALYSLISSNDTDSMQVDTTTNATNVVSSELDKIDLVDVSTDYYNEADRSLVFFSDEINHFVPVYASENNVYAANLFLKNTEQQIDYDKLRDELRIELLGPEYTSYIPEKTEISAMDET
ncbi:MAG: hypothetical protein LC687_02740, partial [Actinobacteria bacterium]|nr:hypothetical protein [Actinomycetota bacterium]